MDVLRGLDEISEQATFRVNADAKTSAFGAQAESLSGEYRRTWRVPRLRAKRKSENQSRPTKLRRPPPFRSPQNSAALSATITH